MDWAEGKTVNIYINSRYAFATAQVHGPIYKERGLLTSEGRIIKNKEEILALLEALWKPKAVALIHCKGHQKGDSPEARENRAADLQARQAALGPVKPLPLLVTLPAPNLPRTPTYSPEEENFAKEQGGRQDSTGWWILLDIRIVLPEALEKTLVKDTPGHLLRTNKTH